MIASLRGTVLTQGTEHLVVEVGGVGLLVYAPVATINLATPGQAMFLHTHLVVREDALTLYGFADAETRAVFVTLLGVSGIGAKLALAILSTLSIEMLRAAVGQEQAEVLSRVPGVGKKTAERIIFNLRDKLGPSVGAPLSALDDSDTEVIAALTALGYSVVEAQTALQQLPKDAPEDIEARIVLALRYFGG